MDIKHLGDYFYFNEPIAHGSFSIIFKGKSKDTSTNIAIKKITRVLDKKYLDSEIQLLKTLNHPNIITFYQEIYDHSDIYLVFEYCNNGHLGNYIETKSKENDYKFLVEILYGLEYLFLNNITHRDIKPQNILIKDNQIKISDFGFAKNCSEDDLLGTFCGSPLYMAPELFQMSSYTSKSDIWSLGVILYELIVKSHPYPSKNRTELITKLKSNSIDFSMISDPLLQDFISKMLKVNPEERIDWSGIFKDPWYILYKRRILDKPNEPLFKPRLFERESKEKRSSKTVINLLENLNKSKEENEETSSEEREIEPVSISEIKPVSPRKIQTNDDFQVISRSAPSEIGKSLMEDYIKTKEPKEKNNYGIITYSPKSNDSSMGYVVNKSINTLKSWFKL
jgi:serine/threonine protein kinase